MAASFRLSPSPTDDYVDDDATAAAVVVVVVERTSWAMCALLDCYEASFDYCYCFVEC